MAPGEPPARVDTFTPCRAHRPLQPIGSPVRNAALHSQVAQFTVGGSGGSRAAVGRFRRQRKVQEVRHLGATAARLVDHRSRQRHQRLGQQVPFTRPLGEFDGEAQLREPAVHRAGRK